MAQASDSTVDNGTGAAVRSDINSRLAALYTNHSGSTDTTMVTKYAYQTWADTTADQLKLRNAANNGWIPLRGLTDGAVEADTILPFKIGGTTLMNIGGSLSADNGGKSLLWSTTTIPINTDVASDEGVQITERGKIHIGQSSRVCLVLNRMTDDGKVANFQRAGTETGSITVTSSSTAYNTSSDYRLKENVVALTGAKARVNDLEVKRFNFLSTPSVTVDGFLAHEVQSVVPEAITGQHNEVDSDGNPVYQGIDQSKLVPLLTAALQEAFAEITALTARVEALEAA